MQTQEIRRKFLNYFKERQHAIIPSSSVVPHDDPTLLFNNAGMNQFKDVFLGRAKRDYKRAATSQKCVRVGGKHNDLENVGHTKRHLTFFEMLGNFSFGDYFKPQAIQYAWEVTTTVFGMDPDRIWPTVFRDDDEAYELWKKYVPAERITRFGEKENFWAMGDTGPCGPCSELLFDRGPRYGNARNPLEDPEGERFLEFWNLVFMQYNRQPTGEMQPLPKPSIDTGAGIERAVSLILDVESVFETDILRSMIARVEEISGIPYQPSDSLRAPAFRVIADHLRCLSFAIADGVQPSNVDRGYVLRKVLRRAVRYGRQLGMEEPFLAKVLSRLVDLMGEDYPELKKSEGRIAEIVTLEEEAFLRTLRRGGNLLNQVMERSKSQRQISGDDAFKLKDTYGLPIEEVLLIAKDADLSVDFARYQELEKEAKERSRSAQKVTQQLASESLFEDFVRKQKESRFIGYDEQSARGKVTGLLVNGAFVETMEAGDEGMVILDQTPFYAEMGGQIGDSGILRGVGTEFEVSDCQAPYKGVIAHIGKLFSGRIALGDSLEASIDPLRRQKIANNHTATHLLHWALHQVLGEHVKQAGSVVDPERLRFDFSHHKPMTEEEICRIEDLINDKIRENSPVKWYEIGYDQVQNRPDIKQFFGEKYGAKVRVIDIDYSKELCGGTHTNSTGTIGLFRIAKEGSIAAGVRRIEAVTGQEAEKLHRESDKLIHTLSERLKAQPQKLLERVDKLNEENKMLAAEVKTLKLYKLQGAIDRLLQKAEPIQHLPVLFAEVDLNAEELRLFADEALLKLKSGMVVAASGAEDKCSVHVRVSDDWVEKGIKASEVVKAIAPIIEGSGGGRPNSAQAGGKAPQNIGKAFDAVRTFIRSSLRDV